MAEAGSRMWGDGAWEAAAPPSQVQGGVKETKTALGGALPLLPIQVGGPGRHWETPHPFVGFQVFSAEAVMGL